MLQRTLNISLMQMPLLPNMMLTGSISSVTLLKHLDSFFQLFLVPLIGI